tara:strand:- start:7292 stop:8596 length:1305 start_codon:yes stop_codon:yes gene_type:complete
MALKKDIISIFKRDIIVFFLTFLTSIFIARRLGPELLGIWTILRIVFSYSEAFGRSKVDVASVYFIGRKKFSRADILSNVNFITLISSSFMILLALIFFQSIYSWLFSQAVGSYIYQFIFLICIVPINFFYSNYLYFHIAVSNIKYYNQMILIQSLANTIFSFLFLFFSDLQLWGLLIASLVSNALAFGYGWYRVPGIVKSQGETNLRTSISMLKYGLQFYISSLLSEFQQSGSRLLSVAFVSPAYVGFLSQAHRLSLLLEKIENPINTALFPRISSSSHESATETTCKVFRISSVLIIFSTIIFYFIVKPLILFLYGPEFLPVALAVYIILPGTGFGCMSAILNSFYAGTGKAIINSYIQFLPICLQLLLAWYLLPRFGYIASPLSYSVGMFFYISIYIIYFLRNTKISPALLLVTKNDIRFIFYSLKTIFTH